RRCVRFVWCVFWVMDRRCTKWYIHVKRFLSPWPDPTGEPVPPARDALLDKAMAHVAAHGMSDLSLRELASAIGTSHRMLLYHFGSREGLVSAIVASMEQTQRDALASLSDEAATPRELIERQWVQLTDPAVLPFVALFFEVLAMAVHE